MAQVMNDEQRLKVLEAYNPQDHLIAVGKNKDNSPVLYYPANWRLYELSLRYPNANMDSEILYNDDKGNIVIRARLWLGKSYEESEKKAVAMKQGKMSELDKVEKKAKARAASDFGVGTEYALDFDDVDVNEVQREQRGVEASPQTQATATAARRTTESNAPTADQLATIGQLAAAANRRVAKPTTYSAAKALIAELRAVPA